MKTSDFDYELPPSAIAQEPVARGRSRLLVVDPVRGSEDREVSDLPDLLEAGDLLVLNDTRVLPARLHGTTEQGGRLELLLLEKLGPRSWEALVRPGRKARPGRRLRFGDELGATVEGRHEERFRILFDDEVEPWLERLGHVPLPPYIARPDRPEDRERYQTIWAREPGAVAAPTAGLHFDQALLDAIGRAGVEVAHVTLHVGLGTFRPVEVEEIERHRMHDERYHVPQPTAAAIERTRSRGGKVVAIGTTVVRTLEAAALAAGPEQGVAVGAGRTDLFITPGFRFRVVDRLLTNFHLPRSTLLMMVSAFAGRERVLAAYRRAIELGYRFYSYGDAMLLEREDLEG